MLQRLRQIQSRPDIYTHSQPTRSPVHVEVEVHDNSYLVSSVMHSRDRHKTGNMTKATDGPTKYYDKNTGKTDAT